MSRWVDWFKSVYALHFSKPSGERPIYRHVRKSKPSRVVELGMGSTRRAQRLIKLAQLGDETAEMEYFGVDWFEARSEVSGGVPLKTAHRQLKALGAKVRLFPGDAYSVLSRHANALSRIDLVLIAADQDPDSVARAWNYLPRMLHEDSVVFVEEPIDLEEDDAEEELEFRYRKLRREEIIKHCGANLDHIGRAA